MTIEGDKVLNSLSEQTLNIKSSKKKDFDVNTAKLVYGGIKSILKKLDQPNPQWIYVDRGW